MAKATDEGSGNPLAPKRWSVDEIIEDLVLELSDAEGKDLVLSEGDTRDVVRSFVTTLTGLDRVYRREWSRKQRLAKADHAKILDALLAQLESRLADPLAPAPDAEFLSGIERLRAECRFRMQLRPKGGQGANSMKRSCAGSALHLMQHLSRRPISGSAETPYPVITALLYEAATAKRENCKRACDWILRYHLPRG